MSTHYLNEIEDTTGEKVRFVPTSYSKRDLGNAGGVTVYKLLDEDKNLIIPRPAYPPALTDVVSLRLKPHCTGILSAYVTFAMPTIPENRDGIFTMRVVKRSNGEDVEWYMGEGVKIFQGGGATAKPSLAISGAMVNNSDEDITIFVQLSQNTNEDLAVDFFLSTFMYIRYDGVLTANEQFVREFTPVTEGRGLLAASDSADNEVIEK